MNDTMSRMSGKCRVKVTGSTPTPWDPVELIYLQLCLGAFLLTIGAFLLASEVFCFHLELSCLQWASLVAHDCGYPLLRYTCRTTHVAADFLDFIAFCRCSSGVAPHPLKILVSRLPPPPFPGGVAPKFGSEKVSRYTGVSQLQLRVSRYTVQLSGQVPLIWAKNLQGLKSWA